MMFAFAPRGAVPVLASLLAACGGGRGARLAEVELEKGGSFTIQLFRDAAPKTVANFEQKARAGFYNGLIFHRVEDWVVQGGDPKGNGTGGGTMPSEYNDRPFLAGAVGVARGPDKRINNDAQFFICKRPAEWLNREYTNFGQVTAGMDVVQAIRVGDKIKRITLKA
jgi:cyclophilin family peptidyl-prolyl cis-trans isomerase